MMNNIQCLDIGNSSTKLGIFKGEELLTFFQFKTCDLLTKPKLLVSEIQKNQINLVYCSVVPKVEVSVKKALTSYDREILAISSDVCAGIPLSYSNKREIGADRIANSIAAFYSLALPCVVIDVGTATTFDIISQKGGYEGGVILPGPQGFLDFLESNTALLPKIELPHNYHSKRPYGKSTLDAMLIGVFSGYKNMIQGVVRDLREYLAKKHSSEVKFVICGGSNLELDNDEIEISENLTLHGLRIAYEFYHK